MERKICRASPVQLPPLSCIPFSQRKTRTFGGLFTSLCTCKNKSIKHLFFIVKLGKEIMGWTEAQSRQRFSYLARLSR